MGPEGEGLGRWDQKEGGAREVGPEGEGLGRWDHSEVESGMRPVEGGGNLCMPHVILGGVYAVVLCRTKQLQSCLVTCAHYTVRVYTVMYSVFMLPQ